MGHSSTATSFRGSVILAVLVVSLLSLATVLISCSSSTSPDDPVLKARFTVSPQDGTVLTDFTFDAGGSSGGSRTLEYRWDWEGDGTWDTEWLSESSIARRFDGVFQPSVILEIRDDSGTDTTSQAVAVDTRHGHVLAANLSPVSATWVLGNDGTHFWMSSWNTKRIYKVDPATGDTLESYDPPSGWPSGIAWDGTSLWITDYLFRGTGIVEVDPDTWQMLGDFPVPYSAFPGGLAWDGEHLWVSAREADTLYVVSPDDGSVVRTVFVPDLARDLTVMDGYVWAICSGSPEEYRKIVP